MRAILANPGVAVRVFPPDRASAEKFHALRRRLPPALRARVGVYRIVRDRRGALRRVRRLWRGRVSLRMARAILTAGIVTIFLFYQLGFLADLWRAFLNLGLRQAVGTYSPKDAERELMLLKKRERYLRGLLEKRKTSPPVRDPFME